LREERKEKFGEKKEAKEKGSLRKKRGELGEKREYGTGKLHSVVEEKRRFLKEKRAHAGYRFAHIHHRCFSRPRLEE